MVIDRGADAAEPTTTDAQPREPEAEPGRASRRRIPLLFDPTQRSTAVVAAIVLAVSSVVSWLLYQQVDAAVPSLPPPGTVWVGAPSADFQDLRLTVKAWYSAQGRPDGEGTRFGLEVVANHRLPKGVRITLCGRVADGLANAGRGVFEVGGEISAATLVPGVAAPLPGVGMQPGEQCTASDVTAVGTKGTEFRVSYTTPGAWGVTSGVTAYYEFPGVFILSPQVEGTVQVISLPSDLAGFESVPGASDPPATWTFDRTEDAEPSYRLTAVSREAQATQQRLNIALGIALGIAGNAAIWLLDVAVVAVSRRREESDQQADAPPDAAAPDGTG